MRPRIGERVEVDLFGLRAGALKSAGVDPHKGTATGTIIALAPGTITIRLDGRAGEVTVGPARLVRRGH
jgi:hypothetical protein